MHILFLLAQELGRHGVQGVRAQFLLFLDHNHHVEDHPPVDVDLCDLAAGDGVDALARPLVGDAAELAEFPFNALDLGAIEEVGQVEAGDVVAGDDVGVDLRPEVAEAEEQVLLLVEGENLGTSDVVARIQCPHGVRKVLARALLLQIGRDLDDWALLGPREALALGVVALDVEGKNSQGGQLDDVHRNDMLEVHIHLDLASAHLSAWIPHLKVVTMDPTAADEGAVNHEAQGERDVRLVGGVSAQICPVGQREPALHEATACRHQAWHGNGDFVERRMLVGPLPAQQRGALHHFHGEHEWVGSISAAAPLQLLLEGGLHDTHPRFGCGAHALEVEVRVETMDVRQYAVPLRRHAVHPQHRNLRLHTVGRDEPGVGRVSVIIDVHLHEGQLLRQVPGRRRPRPAFEGGRVGVSGPLNWRHRGGLGHPAGAHEAGTRHVRRGDHCNGV
mmetsp:Transcript_125134/g.359336  ORF Transcript_125134/g.359336 Transcript_125134/m.359336 type:complete len:447 (-) Transcript_125134:69-1409(-)